MGWKHTLPRLAGAEAAHTRKPVTRKPTGIRFIEKFVPRGSWADWTASFQTAHAQRFSGGSRMARCPEPASITTEGCLWTVPHGHWNSLDPEADDPLDRLPTDGEYRLCNDGAGCLCFTECSIAFASTADGTSVLAARCGPRRWANLEHPNGKSISLRNPVLVVCASRVVEFFPGAACLHLRTRINTAEAVVKP